MTQVNVAMFETEIGAAYSTSKNQNKEIPLAILDKGEKVTVLKDVYGKDYWACKVQSNSGTKGWVLCSNLTIKGGA